MSIVVLLAKNWHIHLNVPHADLEFDKGWVCNQAQQCELIEDASRILPSALEVPALVVVAEAVVAAVAAAAQADQPATVEEEAVEEGEEEEEAEAPVVWKKHGYVKRGIGERPTISLE
jgi:hypothetical protein